LCLSHTRVEGCLFNSQSLHRISSVVLWGGVSRCWQQCY
jgi:hypothetical protein